MPPVPPLPAFIRDLPPALAPLRALAERLDGRDRQVTGDAVRLGHRPAIAPQAFALTLFAPLAPDALAHAAGQWQLAIPKRHLDLLAALNGAFAFQWSLFGLPAPEQGRLLDRGALQPHNLAIANHDWKAGYAVPRDWFHVGASTAWSPQRPVGYFLDGDGVIHASEKRGGLVASWPDIQTFLHDELARAEAASPAHAAIAPQGDRPA